MRPLAPPSSWRRPGPIAAGRRYGHDGGDSLFQQVAIGVMGPGFRQDDIALFKPPSSYFVSGQPLSLAVKNAFSPGTTASCL
ncbi:hypothetical protein ABIB90_000656 [Bradyrhizobium sp. JR4.1]